MLLGVKGLTGVGVEMESGPPSLRARGAEQLRRVVGLGLGLRKAAGYRKVVRALGFSDGGKFWGKKF